jgi:hypothetical protein
LEKVDRQRYEECLVRLTEVLTDIASHADEVSRSRCPYKNRLDECTAPFGCRNKRRPERAGGGRICGGDDKLDYRSAWEAGSA